MRNLSAWVVAVAVGGAAMAGCSAGIPGIDSGRVKDVDRWESVTMQAYSYPETCGAGPWEITFPAREVRWGRQIVVQVLGPRRVPVAYDVTLEREGGDLSKRRVVTLSTEILERDHARCRIAGGGEGAAVSSEGEGASEGEAVPEGSMAEGSVQGEAEASLEVGGTPLTLLRTFRASKKTQYAFGVTFFAGGRPERADDFANEGFRIHQSHGSSYVGDASAQVRIRLWLTEPSDLEGINFVFRDQDLVPDTSRISIEEYERTFAARVDAYDAARGDRERASEQRDAERAAERERLCAREPDHWQCEERGFTPPPPPRAERQPPAPEESEGVVVQWIPGHWQFDSSVEGEYVWVPGTYKVEVTQPRQDAPPPPAAVDDGQTQEVAADAPPRPPPRDETIPPPPAIDGATWVAGHYRLEGNVWVWVPGAWQVPPEHGARRTLPRVEVRGGVRIYVPGSWITDR